MKIYLHDPEDYVCAIGCPFGHESCDASRLLAMHRVYAVEGLPSFNWPQVSLISLHNTFHHQEYLPGTPTLNKLHQDITPVSMSSTRSSLQIPSYHPYPHYILKLDGVISSQHPPKARWLRIEQQA